MKHILIFSHALELGGAERSLIGLLHSLDYSKVCVDLFLMRHAGELIAHIPQEVNLLPEIPQYAALAIPIKSAIRKGQIGVALGRTFGKFAAKRYNKSHKITSDSGVALEYSHKYTYSLMPAIQKEKNYDLAISFLTPHYIVANKVQAKKKLAWIHTDYRQIQVNVESEEKMWAAYDHIVSISEAVTQGFVKVFPTLKNKIVLIENILPERLIRCEAEEVIRDMPRVSDEKILLSVGRFCRAKNFDNIPQICANLLRLGMNVKWYLIGFGADEALIRQRISEAGMQEHVIVLGKKSNPYPYIKACDLYVQPSRYEGKCVTVREAQLLGKPVIITDYATSSSQLENGEDGLIVPMDNEDCAAGIADLLYDPARMVRLIQVCKKRDYSNSEEAQKFQMFV